MGIKLHEIISAGDDDFFSELFVACIVLDKNTVVHCNQLAMTLFPVKAQKDLKGKNLNEFIAVPLVKTMTQLISQISDEKTTASTLHEDGDDSYYIQLKRLANEQIFIVIKDRTLEKQYDQLLLNKMQLESVSHLAAGVAHELRNPLSVIQGFIQLSNVTGNFSKYYQTVLSEIKRMNHIIEDFLSVARKKVDKYYLKPEELLSSIKALIHSECLLHGIHFDYKLHSNKGTLYVNESMIKQVMLNLLRNTIEACSENPKNCYFRLHAGADKKDFVIFIEDNGPGMSEQVMEQLENPFYTTKDTGTGIGIPMCKKIIKEHGGLFTVQSEENKGTKVTIKLPLAEKEETMEEEQIVISYAEE